MVAGTLSVSADGTLNNLVISITFSGARKNCVSCTKTILGLITDELYQAQSCYVEKTFLFKIL